MMTSTSVSKHNTHDANLAFYQQNSYPDLFERWIVKHLNETVYYAAWNRHFGPVSGENDLIGLVDCDSASCFKQKKARDHTKRSV